MSGASMMQGSGRPQVSDEDAMSFVGGNFGAPVKLSEKHEKARNSPNQPENQPESARNRPLCLEPFCVGPAFGHPFSIED